MVGEPRLDHRFDRGPDAFTGVQDEQAPMCGQLASEPDDVLHRRDGDMDGAGDLRQDVLWCRCRGEVCPPDGPGRLGGQVSREAGFARTSGTSESDQAPVDHQLPEPLDLLAAPDELTQRAPLLASSRRFLN